MAHSTIDAFFTLLPQNIRFISNFSGSSGAIFLTPEKSYFLTDARYVEQAAREVKGFEIIETKKVAGELVKLVNSLSPRTVGFEGDHISFSQYSEFQRAFNNSSLLSTAHFIEDFREVKSLEEISCIKKAVAISALAFKKIVPMVKIGVTEKEIATQLEYEMSRNGSERVAFDTIVASGERGALPHGIASSKKIQAGEMVTIDFGATYKGYHSDCTRTLFVGEVDSKQKDIYNVVYSAQKKAIETVKAGVTAHEIDLKARAYIKKSGFGENFGHGTGHGVGLEIHEGPVIREGQETTLKKGMVITVEPGIYIPESGGVRIEDMLLVEEEGYTVLTSSIPKTIL